MTTLSTLPPSERIEHEAILGVYPFAEEETRASMPLPTVTRLLSGTRLLVPAPRGELVDRDVSPLVAELKRAFGGWFALELRPFLQLHARLESATDRAQLRAAGMTMNWDVPRFAFYELAFAADGWRVQASGDPGAFHCIFLARELSEAEALGPGGHVRQQPRTAVEALLRRALPELQLARFKDRTAKHAPNVFDLYLEDRRAKIKTGVRTFAAGRYFHGIRIDLQP